MHVDWINVTSRILQILETNEKIQLDTDVMCRFAANAAFERRISKEHEDVSAGMARLFKQILRKLFHNRLASVQPAAHRTKTNCSWASMFFVLGQRSIGLHFLSAEPYFEVFKEATGEALTPESTAAALELLKPPPVIAGSAQATRQAAAQAQAQQVLANIPKPAKRPTNAAPSPAAATASAYLPPWLANPIPSANNNNNNNSQTLIRAGSSVPKSF